MGKGEGSSLSLGRASASGNSGETWHQGQVWSQGGGGSKPSSWSRKWGRERVRVSWRSSVFFGLCQPREGEGERPEGGGWGWWKDPSLCLTLPHKVEARGRRGEWRAPRPGQGFSLPAPLWDVQGSWDHRVLGSEASQVRMWATVRSGRAGRRRTGRCHVGRMGLTQKHNRDPLALNSLQPGPARALYKRPWPCALLFPPKPEGCRSSWEKLQA